MISLYLEDQMEESLDSLDSVEWRDLDPWRDTVADNDYLLATQAYPTEQDLLATEADQENYLDDRVMRRERRTALRH